MAEDEAGVTPERAVEILEGAQPTVGGLTLVGDTLVQNLGEDFEVRIPIRGATFVHNHERDLAEMFFGIVATLVLTPVVFGLINDACGFITLALGALFSFIMWTKGHYLVVTRPDGEVTEVFVSDDLAEELDLLVLRLTTEQLSLEAR